MKVAIYPGSFDPITLGHMDIIDRGCGLFDKIVVAVAQSEGKRPLFSLDERVRLVKEIYKDNERVEVLGFPRQLTVDLAREHNACAIIRGLRAVADFEYEFQMAGMNSKLGPNIETIFLMASENLQLTSARFVKEIAFYDGEIKNFVPENVLRMFTIKRKEKND